MLYSFSALSSIHTNADGAGPAGLVQASDGNLYETASQGGAGGNGTIFRINLAGAFTALYSFRAAGTGDGSYPDSDLLQASNSSLYWTTYGGGSNRNGTILKITTGGAYTSLYCFSAGSINTDGATPTAGLLQASNGILYGTAASGGANGTGTVFLMDLSLILNSLVPSSVDAVGPSCTMIAKGSGFSNGYEIAWNGFPLSNTTFVSSAQLKATVTSSLIASPGTALVTVVNPSAGGGVSNAKKFSILQTTLKITAASLTRNTSNNTITDIVTIKNSGYLMASNTQVKKSTLNQVATTTTLPLVAGNIAAGQTATVTLIYPGNAGTSGQVVKLSLSGTFTNGTFSLSKSVTLP